MKPRIALFASGTGTNAENIIKYFQQTDIAKVGLLLSNNPKAGVLEKANALRTKSYVFDRKSFYETEQIIDVLKDENIDLVILAGFLWLVPENLVRAFSDRIINVHPALLPKYGGKGMYGAKVHEAVWEARETETGITIHLVNEEYDKGEVLFQAKTIIDEGDTPTQIAEKIHLLEQTHFPKVIESFIENRLKIK